VTVVRVRDALTKYWVSEHLGFLPKSNAHLRRGSGFEPRRNSTSTRRQLEWLAEAGAHALRGRGPPAPGDHLAATGLRAGVVLCAGKPHVVVARGGTGST